MSETELTLNCEEQIIDLPNCLKRLQDKCGDDDECLDNLFIECLSPECTDEYLKSQNLLESEIPTQSEPSIETEDISKSKCSSIDTSVQTIDDLQAYIINNNCICN